MTIPAPLPTPFMGWLIWSGQVADFVGIRRDIKALTIPRPAQSLPKAPGSLSRPPRYHFLISPLHESHHSMTSCTKQANVRCDVDVMEDPVLSFRSGYILWLNRYRVASPNPKLSYLHLLPLLLS